MDSMLGFIHNNLVTMDNDLLYPISSYFVAKNFQVRFYFIEVSARYKDASSFNQTVKSG